MLPRKQLHRDISAAAAPGKLNRNIEGIVGALRYLSSEAASAGLLELATTLDEVALKWDRRLTRNPQKYYHSSTDQSADDCFLQNRDR